MVKTTREELGEAYTRASIDLFRRHGDMSARALGARFREEHGLHHRYRRRWFGMDVSSVEFPNDRDYTAFMLRWS